MIPAGTYPAVVVPVEVDGEMVSIQWGPASQNSPLSAAVAFEILSGQHAGQTITAFLHFSTEVKPGSKTGKSQMDRSIESLRYCGFTGDDIDQFFSQNPENEVSITVEHEEYQGKTRAKVAWINKPGGGGGFVLQKRMAPTDLKKMAARMKSKIKAAPVYEGKKAERQAPTASEGEGTGGWNGLDQGDPDPTAGTQVREPGADDDSSIPF